MSYFLTYGTRRSKVTYFPRTGSVIEGTTLLIPREFRRSLLNPALSPFGYRAFPRNSDRFPKICAIVPRIASECPDQFSNVQGHKLRHTCGPNELLSNVRNTTVNSYLRVCEAKPRPSIVPCLLELNLIDFQIWCKKPLHMRSHKLEQSPSFERSTKLVF